MLKCTLCNFHIMKYYYDFLTLKNEKTTLSNLGHTNRLWQMGQWGVWCLSPGLQRLEVLGALSSLSNGPHQTDSHSSFFLCAVVAGLQGHQKGRIWEFPGGPVVRAPLQGSRFIPGWGTKILHVAWPKKIFLRSDRYKKIKVISISLLSSLEDFLQVYFLNI